jgi:hypothetical protein
MRLNEFQKVAQMLAKEHKITIEEGERWACNLKTKFVYFVKNDIYNLSEDHILGLTLHEIAHIHYTSEFKAPADNPELTHTVWNALEDNAIENIIGRDYPNAGEILASTNDEVLDTLIKILPKISVSMFEKSILYASARFMGRGYAYGMTQYEKIGDEIATIMIKNRKNILERKHSDDLMPLAIQIKDLLIAKLGQPTDKEKQQMADEAKFQGGAERQGNNNSRANQSGPGKPGTIGTSANGSAQSAKEALVTALKAGQGWQMGASAHQGVNFIDSISDQAKIIGKQLRTVLKRNNAMEFGGRYRTGKLLSKRFVRVIANRDRHPFARRIVKSNQSYAFAIASDISGSMFNGNGENQASYALTSMHMVSEALRIAGVPRSMIVFGQNAAVASPMNKLQVPWSDLSAEKTIRKAGQNSTNIDRAILMCVDQLAGIKAERKIMIVLTDGQSNIASMMEAHKKATQADIECLGITIGSSYDARDMSRVFGEKKNTNITDTRKTSLIGKAFIDILKQSITRG